MRPNQIKNEFPATSLPNRWLCWKSSETRTSASAKTCVLNVMPFERFLGVVHVHPNIAIEKMIIGASSYRAAWV